MGWDVTYHPISKDEIGSIYFRGLEADLVPELVQRFEVDDFFAEQLAIRFKEARELEEDVPFSKGHAYYIAIISGFLRKYHYVRGGALSFLAADPVFAEFWCDWNSLVPPAMRNRPIDGYASENYSGGVFLEPEALARLRLAYDGNAYVREKLDQLFSHGRLPVFWRAVDEAVAQRCGLLEAIEVVIPNPFNLNQSTSVSNLLNCHPDGALLYAEAAQQQIAQALEQNPPPTGPASRSPRRWWDRLFRR